MPDCIDPGYLRSPTVPTAAPGTVGLSPLVPTYERAPCKRVPFNREETSDESGRRRHLYEYPLSDRIGYKDLGRKARSFSVTAYLNGGDQVAQTRAMAPAAESPE